MVLHTAALRRLSHKPPSTGPMRGVTTGEAVDAGKGRVPTVALLGSGSAVEVAGNPRAMGGTQDAMTSRPSARAAHHKKGAPAILRARGPDCVLLGRGYSVLGSMDGTRRIFHQATRPDAKARACPGRCCMPLLVLQGGNARQLFALQELKRGTTAGRYVRHLLGHASFLDRTCTIPSTNNGSRPRPGQ